MNSTLNGRNEMKLFKRIRFEIASNRNIEREGRDKEDEKKKSNQKSWKNVFKKIKWIKNEQKQKKNQMEWNTNR